MYENNNSDRRRSSSSNSSSSRSSRPSSGGFGGSDRNSSDRGGDRRRSSFGGGRSSGGFGGGNSGGGNRGGGRRFGRPVKRSNYDLYIKAATEKTEEKKYNSTFLFKDLEVDKGLVEAILALGFVAPTPIQDMAIPHILAKKDVIGLASTGTGKTGAFLIPLIQQAIEHEDKREEWQTLIIAPTRELALQINEEFSKFRPRNPKLFSAVCIGGSNMYTQIQNMKKKNHFIIGTPGRIKDLIERKILNLSKFKCVVLDEVDRMLDMGFIDDINLIVSKLPPERQSLFFSATLSRNLVPIANAFLTNPVTVSMDESGPSQNVHQDVVKTTNRSHKIEALQEILASDNCTKSLIFTQTKMEAENLNDELYKLGYRSESIHGDKKLAYRKRALDSFKTGRVSILVATDVAARGIDVKDISHVINYDEPENYDTYIHRIGRTGRGGSTGWAITFVNA